MLRAALKLDAHAKVNGEYFIRSLYFDSPENLDYNTKSTGVYYRKKLRLRLYDLDQAQIKLEMKLKYGDSMRKETGFISREDAKSLCEGNYDPLIAYENSAINTIYKELKTSYASPKVLIDYDREAYVSDWQNIRINFDKNIRATSSTFDVFDPDVQMVPLGDHQTMVLEVKYTDYLPDYIRDILSSCRIGLTSFSKYCIARESV